MILERLRERNLFRANVRHELGRNDEVGVRVERDGRWERLELRDDRIYVASPGEKSRKRLRTRFGRGPRVLLYDRRRLAVRDDTFPAFEAKFAFAVERRAPLVGLEEVSIVQLPEDRDAFDVLVEHYGSFDAVPKPEPGQYRREPPSQGAPDMDPVALLHRYWLSTHVFFWPQNQPTKGPATLADPTWGDQRTIVVLDTGIKPKHVYFDKKAAYFDNDPQNDDAPLPLLPQYNGHGTAVAGVARQRNMDAQILGARLSKIGDQPTVEEGELVELIDDIRVHGGEHVVLSLSFGGETVGQKPPLHDAIARFRRKGRCDVVAAAGNVTDVADRGPIYPAAWDIVHAVASKDRKGDLHPWSNWGTWVDSYEDGDVVTTSSTISNFIKWQGTSFAAPQKAATIV